MMKSYLKRWNGVLLEGEEEERKPKFVDAGTTMIEGN